MEDTSTSKDKKDIKSKDELNNIKSKYILKKICDYLQTKKSFEIFKYSKHIQKRLNISINNYKEYSEKYSSVEIELIPIKNGKDKLINIPKNEKEYFHIYFNDSKNEIENNKLVENNKVSKIKIIIDYQVKSLTSLFYNCDCIDSLSFKKFNRNNITDMSFMFFGCSSLKELNLSNFNTNNVTNMYRMFCGCSYIVSIKIRKI